MGKSPKEQPFLAAYKLRLASANSMATPFNKIMEKIISEMIISDMKPKLDPAQYGNQEHKSIQHYLVRFLHRILTSLDKNSKREVNAILCLLMN